MSGKLNETRGPIRLDTDRAPITTKPFEDGRKLMFWGPNQQVSDVDPTIYNPPSGLTTKSPLILPRVARFLSIDTVSLQWCTAHLDPLNDNFNTVKPDLSVLATTWPTVRADLAARYAGKYFYGQKYRRQCLLDGVAPTKNRETEKWFGTNMLNIVIVSEPIGYTNPGVNHYTLTWPPAGWTLAVNRIVPYLRRWPALRTIFYVDRAKMASLMANNFHRPEDNVSTPAIPERPSDSDVLTMMDYTITHLTEFCTDNSSWCEYGGTLTSQVDANYFYPLLDEHLRYVAP
jgi:hypothetical protein